MVGKHQVAQALTCIYASGNLGAEATKTVAELLKEKGTLRGKIDETRWEETVIKMPRAGDFSFLEFKPALL